MTGASARDSSMARQIAHARSIRADVASALAHSKPCLQGVGIARIGERIGFHAYLGREPRRPGMPSVRFPESLLAGLPLEFSTLDEDPRFCAQGPATSTPQGTATKPHEQLSMRPLRSGAEIQNLTAFQQMRQVSPRFPQQVGTLGCFVRDRSTQRPGLLSCAHVLDPQCNAMPGAIIVQPRCDAQAASMAAPVASFVRALPLRSNPYGLLRGDPTINFSDFDLALATLDIPKPPRPHEFHPAHGVAGFAGTGDVLPGEDVFKIGRSGVVTRGSVRAIALDVTVPLRASGGPRQEIWFDDTFSITAQSGLGRPFSEDGDSGAVIVRASDGVLVGMLFAIAGGVSYAFPMAPALAAIDCSLL